ncbi:ABC transporter permease [Cumulibacter soli]|uniref:ABC transporter permease n=1 Tax=Cumulibacter soli TaxID=2546344 RepID=UPI0010683129|nr:ABC transporter permease [Cumulibacter soli]
MLRFALGRLIQGIVALLVVLTVVFALARLSGDYATLIAPPDASAEAIKAIQVKLGLDRPIVVQYFAYLGDLFTGNLGDSLSFGSPVSELVGAALPDTLVLAGVAFVFAVVVGVPLGLLAGTKSGGWIDAAVRFLALIGQSVPSFWLGILLVFMFAVNIPILPASGQSGFLSIILPAIALGAFPLASVTRLTRSAVLEVIGKDQTLFLRAKGVGRARLAWHTLRNASLPVVTLSGIQLGNLISGTIVIETLFAWPGMGQLAIQAINNRDYTLIQGVVIVNTVVFIVLLFLIDISYGVLDPRIRRGRD